MFVEQMASLSRHFYRIDEVKASFKYALLKKNIRESVFWCLELIDTMMIEDVFDCIIWCWFYGSCSSYSYLLKLLELKNKDKYDLAEIFPLVQAFCCLDRDASIFWLLRKGYSDEQPDFITGPSFTDQPDLETQSLHRAIQQGKILLAWKLLRCRWGPETWSLLEGYAKGISLLSHMEGFTWECRAAAVLFACRGVKTHPLKLELASEIQESLESWEELEGRRSRRVYKIRPEAITWGTIRGACSHTKKNLSQLRTPLAAMAGSPFWESVAEEIGGWSVINDDDDVKESFFEVYFPDDIPDEWSAADQEKSHGYGLAFEGANQEEKYFRGLLGSFPSLGLVSNTHEAVACVIGDYDEKVEHWSEQQKVWRFKPIKKKIVLVE
jgi:hypothetical protein